MPVVIRRDKNSFFGNHLRSRRTRVAKALWILFGVLVLQAIFVNLPKPHAERDSFESQEYSTHEQRIAWLKEIQAQQQRPPPVVQLTIYNVCPITCDLTNLSDIVGGLPSVDIKGVDIDTKQVHLDDPPIPIIGTDEEHERIVSAWDVAEFMAHVTVWRAVFHGDGGAGIFLSCRVQDPLAVLNMLRKDAWFKNETEGGMMGKDGWDVLLLGAGQKAGAPIGSIRSHVVSTTGIVEEDLLGYAVSRRGADRLLTYVRAFTVPIREFMSVVLEKDIGMLRWTGAGLGPVTACKVESGETNPSTMLPFYPPIHWMHAAARHTK